MRYVLGLCVLALAATIPAFAPTWTVCSSGCDYTSIQAAVDAASDEDTIELGAETFFENVVVDKDLTIRGAGPLSTVVDGSLQARVFSISREVTLAGMTIQNGNGNNGGGIGPIAFGEHSPLTLDNLVLRSNFGGGVFHSGNVVITNTLIEGNTAQLGGGVYVSYGATMVAITNTVISGNYATGYEGTGGAGGGLWVYTADVTIDSSEITGNSATGGFGAGISTYQVATMRISNSTISENVGTGISTSALLEVESSTVSGNMGDGLSLSGGRGATIKDSTIVANQFRGLTRGRNVTVQGSIVAANGFGDCQPLLVTSMGYNISGDTSCGFTQPGDQENTAPLVLALADNGGPTPTHALHPDSPAIDAGGDECEPTDQRGVVRPADGDGDGIALCDIGSFEFVPLGSVDLLDALTEQVVSLALPHGIENSLLAKLDAALWVLTDVPTGNDHAAVNILGVFVNQVEAQHGKKIAAADADALIDAAQEIIGLL